MVRCLLVSVLLLLCSLPSTVMAQYYYGYSGYYPSYNYGNYYPNYGNNYYRGGGYGNYYGNNNYYSGYGK